MKERLSDAVEVSKIKAYVAATLHDGSFALEAARHTPILGSDGSGSVFRSQETRSAGACTSSPYRAMPSTSVSVPASRRTLRIVPSGGSSMLLSRSKTSRDRGRTLRPSPLAARDDDRHLVAGTDTVDTSSPTTGIPAHRLSCSRLACEIAIASIGSVTTSGVAPSR
jgi:hypothetical protein